MKKSIKIITVLSLFSAVSFPAYAASGYKLPFTQGQSVKITQYPHSSTAYDGKEQYAWDMVASDGTIVPIVASKAGKVSLIKTTGINGTCNASDANNVVYVIITHDDGNQSVYLHMASGSLKVKSGDYVHQGQEIGTIGNTGYSCGTHLHFQVQQPYSTWFGYSIPITFDDVIKNNGIPTQGNVYKSDNYYNPLSYFDGAGSIVRPNENCWGCQKDQAKMHSRIDLHRNSTVVFQWRNINPNTCHHIDVSTSLDIGTVSVQARNWAEHLTKTGFVSKLPVSVMNEGEWTIFSVTSTQPLTSDVTVTAECKPSTSPEVGSKNPFTTPNLVEFDQNYFWSGNGSIISSSSELGYGGTNDDAVTFDGVGHNSLTVFQWYKKSSCSKLKIGRPDPNSRMNDAIDKSPIDVSGVYIKGWSVADFDNNSNLCTQLPCTISAPTDERYYLVKIKSTSAAILGGKLRAVCTN